MRSPAARPRRGRSTPPRRRSLAAPPRSPRRGDRRTEIIAATIQVIARDGLRACTVSALEHETGFARGHFTYHFQSKEEIIALAFATVGADWATAQIAASGGAIALARIENGVRAAVDWVQRRPDYFRCLMSFRVEMMRDPNAFPQANVVRTQMWEFCAQMIRDGIAQGTIAPRLDPVVEGRTVFAIVDGMLMQSVLDPSFCPPDALADRVWRVVADRLVLGSAVAQDSD